VSDELIEFLTQAVKEAQTDYDRIKAVSDRARARLARSHRLPAIDDALISAMATLRETKANLGAAIASRYPIDGYKISHKPYTGKDALSCAIKESGKDLL
jgi:hypothetical protein